MELFSPYIIAAGLGWIIAQSSKYLIASIKQGKIASFRQLYLSGNMPSAHSATAVALLTVIAYRDGVGSGLFALALVFTSIVVYDAVMVRRSSGEQGVALRKLLKETKSKVSQPRVAMGHTPLEVFVGGVIGVIVGLSVIALN